MSDQEDREIMLRRTALDFALAWVKYCEAQWETLPSSYRIAAMVSIRRGFDHIDISISDGMGAQVLADRLIGVIDHVPYPPNPKTSKTGSTTG